MLSPPLLEPEPFFQVADAEFDARMRYVEGVMGVSSNDYGGELAAIPPMLHQIPQHPLEETNSIEPSSQPLTSPSRASAVAASSRLLEDPEDEEEQLHAHAHVYARWG